MESLKEREREGGTQREGYREKDSEREYRSSTWASGTDHIHHTENTALGGKVCALCIALYVLFITLCILARYWFL